MKTNQSRFTSQCGWVVNRIHRKVPARLLAMFSLVLLWTFGAHAQGLIWSASYASYVGNEAGAGPVANRGIAFDHVSDPNFATPPSLNPVTRIFAMSISTNDTGRTFFANAFNEPGFAGFAAGLTDGANGYVRFSEFATFPFGVSTEAGFLGRSLAAPDLAGYSITQIGFRVNSYYDSYYAPENRYLNTLDYSLDFYGAAVPEPGTWALLGLGSTLLWSAARRRRK